MSEQLINTLETKTNHLKALVPLAILDIRKQEEKFSLFNQGEVSKFNFLVAFKDLTKTKKKKITKWIEDLDELGEKKNEILEKYHNYMLKINQDDQMKDYSNMVLNLLKEYKNPKTSSNSNNPKTGLTKGR